jgi:hypothetical protein
MHSSSSNFSYSEPIFDNGNKSYQQVKIFIWQDDGLFLKRDVGDRFYDWLAGKKGLNLIKKNWDKLKLS